MHAGHGDVGTRLAVVAPHNHKACDAQTSRRPVCQADTRNLAQTQDTHIIGVILP